MLFLAKSKTCDDSDQHTHCVHMNFGQDCRMLLGSIPSRISGLGLTSSKISVKGGSTREWLEIEPRMPYVLPISKLRQTTLHTHVPEYLCSTRACTACDSS